MTHTEGRCRVEVRRGDHVESVHEVSVAVVDAEGRLQGYGGDPDRRAYARSAIKAWQALPLVEDGVLAHFAIPEEELALCCASHSGEPRHTELARSLLDRIGAGEEALACGPHWPLSAEAAGSLRATGAQPGRIHNNCSGKHAGMLALARHHGWPLAGYHELRHPVQQRMLREVERWTGLEPGEIGLGVDGCGVVTFALPLFALAHGFARLAAEARRGGSAGVFVGAMVHHPWVVGGTQRLCSELMNAAGGRIFAEVGAEGVYCAGVPEVELGLALKVHDGATRAAEPALLGVLRALALLTDAELRNLASWAVPVVTNTRGEQVGAVRCQVELAGAGVQAAAPRQRRRQGG
jgi:L-asparaginase II